MATSSFTCRAASLTPQYSLECSNSSNQNALGPTCTEDVTIWEQSPHVPGEGTYLHRPEVEGQEEKHSDKAAHKAPAEPVTAHIGDDGTHSEEQMEEGGQGVPRENPGGSLTQPRAEVLSSLQHHRWNILPQAVHAQASVLRTHISIQKCVCVCVCTIQSLVFQSELKL